MGGSKPAPGTDAANLSIAGAVATIYGLTRPWRETDYSWNVFHTYTSTGMRLAGSLGWLIAGVPFVFLLVGRIRGEADALRIGANAAWVAAAVGGLMIIWVRREPPPDAVVSVTTAAYLTVAAAVVTGALGRLAADRVQGPNAKSGTATRLLIRIAFAGVLALGLLKSCAGGFDFDGGGGYCDDLYVACE